MYDTLRLLDMFAFLAAVPLILAIRTVRPRLMPWWLAALLAAGVGWLASSVGAYLDNKGTEAWIEEHTLEQPASLDNPYPIVERWSPPAWSGCVLGIVYLAILAVPWWISRSLLRRARVDPVFGARLRLRVLLVCLALAIVGALAFYRAS